jgi:hypothetical protein
MKSQWGISEARIEIENEIAPNVRGRPTLRALAHDYQVICVEVTDSGYPPQIDPMVVDCKNLGLPVKLYLAIPSGETIQEKTLKVCRSSGVGLLVVGSDCQELQPAMSLSLTGVRSPDAAKTFPAKYRQSVNNAHQNFVSGDPAKGTLLIYEEIEAFTRRLCLKATQKSWWRSGAPSPPDGADRAVPFKRIAKYLASHFDSNAAAMPEMDAYLLDRVVAAAGPRNDAAHKPPNPQALKKRHQELRTRFESGVDLLRDFVKASKNKV